ncbi:MAG: hypothetical protein JHD15_12865 [Phenylobacterium sp.]|uniref:hypothetical protein n=1 Tax=Phenylobacterium sp. TaxID=1871053 RepID=UPI001A2E9332|nr:hypothetical protein [Phenylobacterium sp.]MBJ7411240.1 hypothetical protein [Phenylobacterium sp.]
MSASPPATAVLGPPAGVLRWLHVRQVKPSSGVDRLQRRALNLWWIARAAAEETAQGQAMASTFLTLFSGHLSQTDRRWLRWRDDMAASAEMRRAYSALYGRFFARGMLQGTLALRDFVPLHTQSTQAGAVTVERVVKGDIPDWIAWDPIAGAYVLCEAKGNLTGSTPNFRTATPNCVTNGKDQFDRVKVLDSTGQAISVRGWVGASLWATDRRARNPVFLAYDPDGQGRDLTPDERGRHARALHAQWTASLAEGLGEPALRHLDGPPSLLVQIYVPASPDLPAPRIRTARSPATDNVAGVADVVDVVDKPSPRRHRGLYVPALLTRFGLSPMRGRDARDNLLKAQASARASGEPAWFVGLDRRALAPGFTGLSTWSSLHGVAGADGFAVFDLRAVEIERQFGG